MKLNQDKYINTMKLNQDKIDQLLGILLTVDGKGREAKRIALVELLSIITDLIGQQRVLNEINQYRK